MKTMKEHYETIIKDITNAAKALLSQDSITNDDLHKASKMLEKAEYFQDLLEHEKRHNTTNN
jgi:hypothetical protein